MPDIPVTHAVLKNETVGSKPVPLATVRSSKLAAMAANISKSQNVEQDIDTETSADMDDDVSDNDTNLVKLEDILIVPEMIDNTQDVEDKENDDNESNKVNKGFNQIDSGKSILKDTCDEWRDSSVGSKSPNDGKDNCNRASTSSSKDLSLSCVNSSGVSETSYRLAPT